MLSVSEEPDAGKLKVANESMRKESGDVNYHEYTSQEGVSISKLFVLGLAIGGYLHRYPNPWPPEKACRGILEQLEALLSDFHVVI
jgi:hypothetical protein